MRKKNIQKCFLLILALAMLLALTACGGTPEDPSEVKGETFDAGNISALAPKGWKAFPVSDLFDEYEGDNNPNSMQICKDADDEWDLLSKPYIMITYYDPETSFLSAKDWYDDAEDIESFTLGNYTWEGYTCTSLVTLIRFWKLSMGISLSRLTFWKSPATNWKSLWKMLMCRLLLPALPSQSK